MVAAASTANAVSVVGAPLGVVAGTVRVRLLPQADGDRAGQGVPAEDIGQVPSDTAPGHRIRAARGGMVGATAGTRTVRVVVGTSIDIGTAAGPVITAVLSAAAAVCAVMSFAGSGRGNSVDGAGGPQFSCTCVPSALGQLPRALGLVLSPAFGCERMHQRLLGGDGHRLEQLGERVGGARCGEGARRNGCPAVSTAIRVTVRAGHIRRLGGQDDLDGAGHRAHLLGVLGGIDSA
jgi:hypothetical protein